MRLVQLIAICLLLTSGALHAATQNVPQPPITKLSMPVQYGFTAGVLTIPFKFHLSDHSISGGSTLGGYMGWKTTWMGLTVIPIVSAGLAFSDAKYGQGLTVATGLIGSVGASNMNWGLILGMDWYANDTHYPYEGKPWLAVEIGYNFGS